MSPDSRTVIPRGGHHACAAQDGQLLGKARRLDFDICEQFVYRAWSLLEEFEDADSHGVAESAEQFGLRYVQWRGHGDSCG